MKFLPYLIVALISINFRPSEFPNCNVPLKHQTLIINGALGRLTCDRCSQPVRYISEVHGIVVKLCETHRPKPNVIYDPKEWGFGE